MASSKMRQYYVGLDFGTQSARALVIDSTLIKVVEAKVVFDTDLPKYKTQGGVLRQGGCVTSPSLMWVEALDMLFTQLASYKDDSGEKLLEHVVAISGSAQQHGIVLWNHESSNALARIARPDTHSEESLTSLLSESFALDQSPVWMDSSTSDQCRERAQAMGGAERVAAITGSRPFERFSGNQIARIASLKPDAYADTARISLVSSFLTSLLVGRFACIDVSDGSGMNLLDIHSHRWDQPSCECTAPEVVGRLGDPVPSHTDAGTIAGYFVNTFGINPTCVVITCSGDNPCALAAMQLAQGQVAVSLGTSDTLLFTTATPHPKLDGHILVSPTDPETAMAMLCYKNGSPAREAVARWVGKDTTLTKWDSFSSSVEKSAPGNELHMGFYYFEPEILPPAQGIHRFTPPAPSPEKLPLVTPSHLSGQFEHVVADPSKAACELAPKGWSAAIDARAIVESQFLAMRRHAEAMGLQLTPMWKGPSPSAPRHSDDAGAVFVTGGGSHNQALTQVLADMFGVPVHACEAEGAALGAAYRAVHGCAALVTCAYEVYSKMLSLHSDLEHRVVARSQGTLYAHGAPDG